MPDPVSHAPLLAARGLRFSRNEQLVFGPLDFALDAGEALLVRGDNGAGKTSLLRVLVGLLRADAGEVDIEGAAVQPALRARAMAYLGHLPGLKAELGALENLRYLCALQGRRPGQDMAQALATVGLAGYEDTPAGKLSAGQRKRLSLARLWLSPAPLWLLDEPYANLDLEGIELVNRMVQAHLHAGGAALVTTHGAYAAPPVRTRELVLPTGPTPPVPADDTADDLRTDHPRAAAPAVRTGADPAPATTTATATSGPQRSATPAAAWNRAASLPTLAGSAAALVARDLRLLWHRRGDAFQPVLFAVLVVVLFGLALGGERTTLAGVSAGVLWVAVLLSGLLALDTLFRGDAEDGSLEQWMLSPVPLAWLVLVRTAVHWATTALPLILAAPLLAELMQLPRMQLPALLAGLALGTPLLSLIGAVVAALTVGMRRSGILLALLALPLYVPVLVFGAGSVALAGQGQDPTGGLLLLAAGLVLALVLAPVTAAAAIRIALH